jgi:hypothetical protein
MVSLTSSYDIERNPCLRQTFIAPVFIKIILMSLNEHCLLLFNCLLGSLFIYVFLAFKLPTQLVVFPFSDYLLS